MLALFVLFRYCFMHGTTAKEKRIESMEPVFFIHVLLLCCCISAYASLQRPASSIHRAEPSKPEFSFGKDRELFHASVDLKWLFQAATERRTWRRIVHSVLHNVKLLNRDYYNQYIYKSIASDILCAYRLFNKYSTLRCRNALLVTSCFYNTNTFPSYFINRALHCSLQDAHKLATDKQRLLIFYLEGDSDWEQSARTNKARAALSDSALGNFVNEQVSNVCLILSSGFVDSHVTFFRML